METAGCELQALVLATSEKGEVTEAPLEGIVTVMANRGVTLADNARRERTRDLISPSPRSHSGCILGLRGSSCLHQKTCPGTGQPWEIPLKDLNDHDCSQFMIKIAHNC